MILIIKTSPHIISEAVRDRVPRQGLPAPVRDDSRTAQEIRSSWAVERLIRAFYPADFNARQTFSGVTGF